MAPLAECAHDGEPRGGRADPEGAVPTLEWARLAKLANFAIFVQNFANFLWARSRLYQNEILQENMR